MTIETSASPTEAALLQSKRAERYLVPATFITSSGNALQLTAATVLVFQAGGTTLSVSWLFIAVSIPQVAFSVFFGRLADRFDRRMLTVTADVISAMSAFALPVWLWLGGTPTLGSYLFNFLLAVTAALFMPTSNALVKERILDEHLGKFNSRFELATNAGFLLASASVGLLIHALGVTPLLVFNALTFLGSAAFIYLVGPKAAPAAAAPTVEEAAEAGEVAHSAPTPAAAPAGQPIKRLAVLFGNLSLGIMVANTLLAALILDTFNMGPWLLGVSDAGAFIGFSIGALLYPWIGKRVSLLNLAVFGTLGNLLMFCLQPLHWVALIVCITFAGFCFALSRVGARTLLMKASPVDRVGRIFGGTNAFALGAGITANLLLSTLADRTDNVPLAFWGLAAIQAAIAIGCYISLVKPIAAQEKPSQALEATPA